MQNRLIKKLITKNKFNLRATGKSMLPILRPDDILTYQKTSFQKTQIDDIVLVLKNNQYYTHRVVYKTKKYLVTKGDNNLKSEGKITSNNVFAKVERIKRNNKIIHPENVYLVQSTQYFQQITEITKKFNRKKIDFVILKGLPLHLYYQKTHPKRLFADCDILIQEKDAKKVDKILSGKQFSKKDTSYSPIHKMLKNKKTQEVYVKKVNNLPILLDVHFEPTFLLNQIGRLDMLYPQKFIETMTNEFMEKRVNIKLLNNSFPLLSPDNLIIYLALHFFHHNFQGIYRLNLLNRVSDKYFRNKKNSIKDILKLIYKYKIEAFVFPVFRLLGKKYKCVYASQIANRLETKLNKRQVNYINKKIFPIDIFSADSKAQEGIKRFKNIFFLSREPIIRKIFIFLTPSVAFSFFWIIFRQLMVKAKRFSF